MTILDGRIGRFVKAARSLLMVQAGLALLALALSAWAFLAVRELAADRERLQARVAEMEAQRAALSPVAAAPEPVPPVDPTAPAPAIILPVPVPLDTTGPLSPAVPEPDPAGPRQEPDAAQPVPEVDCAAANANQSRCRPGRWNRRDVPRPRPAQPVAPEPQRGAEQPKPPAPTG